MEAVGRCTPLPFELPPQEDDVLGVFWWTPRFSESALQVCQHTPPVIHISSMERTSMWPISSWILKFEGSGMECLKVMLTVSWVRFGLSNCIHRLEVGSVSKSSHYCSGLTSLHCFYWQRHLNLVNLGNYPCVISHKGQMKDQWKSYKLFFLWLLLERVGKFCENLQSCRRQSLFDLA